jgi:hypothetical protein
LDVETNSMMGDSPGRFMSDHKHAGPSLPEVIDEAADTPNWVPALGLGLFALISLVFAARLAYDDANPPQAAQDGNVAEVAAEGGR